MVIMYIHVKITGTKSGIVALKDNLDNYNNNNNDNVETFNIK